jgi:hypothetical protein
MLDEVNILFIDQPNQVGFSYDTLTNVTASMSREQFEGWTLKPTDFSDGVPPSNLTFNTATVASQNINNTANSTSHAAVGAVSHQLKSMLTSSTL